MAVEYSSESCAVVLRLMGLVEFARAMQGTLVGQIS